MSKIKSIKNGYVALMTIIIIGAIILIKTIIMDQNQELKSHYLANACANHALIKLQDNPNYTGNETVSIDNYDCQVGQILGSGNFNRTINASSSVAGHVANIQVVISQIRPKTLIRSWQEIY